jgi:hypothetical protein
MSQECVPEPRDQTITWPSRPLKEESAPHQRVPGAALRPTAAWPSSMSHTCPNAHHDRVPTSAGVPHGYDPPSFPPVAVTVDRVVLTIAEGELQVLLVERGAEPFGG